MFPIRLQPDQVEFVLLSFEGPDAYSKAGGLGVRVTNLAEYLARIGFQTHLIFIGSPDLPSHEERLDERLHFYRWCQWISRYHPLGVYDGEKGKLVDFSQSVPDYIVENIARPAIAQRRHLVVLAEEWQTAEALIRLSDALHAAGLRSNSILLWNANNTIGFEHIDWPRLSFVSTLTTVSRYMKQIMRNYGLDPLIIPNGIPAELLNPTPEEVIRMVRERLARRNELLLFKVGRYDPAKCWVSAVEAAALLKQGGKKVRFLCRGGIEAHGMEVLSQARDLGLVVKDVVGHPETWQEAVELISGVGAAEVYNLRFGMSPEMLRIFYRAADFILANSKHEPFGLVGLEAMAAGGVVFTGPTGETYSAEGEGAIALDTEQARELVLAIENLQENPEKVLAIRQAAPSIAARYTWENVTAILFEKICLAKDYQKVHPFRVSLFAASKPAQNGAGRRQGIPSKPTAWPIPVQMPVEITISAAVG
jgi:glycosyltransferase involved in cell wall biosynthesis